MLLKKVILMFFVVFFLQLKNLKIYGMKIVVNQKIQNKNVSLFQVACKEHAKLTAISTLSILFSSFTKFGFTARALKNIGFQNNFAINICSKLLYIFTAGCCFYNFKEILETKKRLNLNNKAVEPAIKEQKVQANLDKNESKIEPQKIEIKDIEIKDNLNLENFLQIEEKQLQIKNTKTQEEIFRKFSAESEFNLNIIKNIKENSGSFSNKDIKSLSNNIEAKDVLKYLKELNIIISKSLAKEFSQDQINQLNIEEGSGITNKICYATQIELQKNDIIYTHADFHAGMPFINFLVQLSDANTIDLGNFKLKKNSNGGEVYIIFNGDYVDRGNNGLEIYLLMAKLKIANPGNVQILRGNHENAYIMNSNGFKKELEAKKLSDEKNNEIFDKIVDLCKILPTICYVKYQSGDIIQFNHGALDLYDPTAFLNSKATFDYIDLRKAREDFIKKYEQTYGEIGNREKSNFEDSEFNGKEWYEFDLGDPEQLNYLNKDRGLVLTKKFCAHYFSIINEGKNKIVGHFSGHQHNRKQDDILMNKLISHFCYYNLYGENKITKAPLTIKLAEDGLPQIIKCNVTCNQNAFAAINYDFINKEGFKENQEYFSDNKFLIDYWAKIYWDTKENCFMYEKI